MSLKIIRNDLLKVKAEALVNPSDSLLSGSGSIDYRIHEACGDELEDELSKYKELDVTNLVITKSYNLDTCDYIIHVSGPTYIDGKHNELEQLRTTYRNVLEVSKSSKFESIAIPLISSGTFGFPKKEAYLIAIEEINSFLIENDMKVYLVVYDDESFSISKKLSDDVKSYIEKTLEPEINYKSISINDDLNCNYCVSYDSTPIFELDESFSEALLRIIDDKGLKDSDVYKKAGIDRKLFSKIRKTSYVPSKKTALAFCIALELDLEETNDLLKKAGLALSHAKYFDVIIEYFIVNKHYDFFDINAALLKYDQQLLI